MPKKNDLRDPKQILFLTNYHDPKSKTFGDVKNSALSAGYALKYAENLSHLMPKWLSDNIESDRLLNKAVRNLDKFLDMDDKPNLQADITKFVASKTKNSIFADDNQPKEININVNYGQKETDDYIKWRKERELEGIIDGRTED